MEKDNDYSLFPDENDSEPKRFRFQVKEIEYRNDELAEYITSKLHYKIGRNQLLNILENLGFLDHDLIPTNLIPSDYYVLYERINPNKYKIDHFLKWNENGRNFIIKELRQYSCEQLTEWKKKYSCLRSFPITELF